MFADNMDKEHYVPKDVFTEKQDEIKMKITESLKKALKGQRCRNEQISALAQQIFSKIMTNNSLKLQMYTILTVDSDISSDSVGAKRTQKEQFIDQLWERLIKQINENVSCAESLTTETGDSTAESLTDPEAFKSKFKEYFNDTNETLISELKIHINRAKNIDQIAQGWFDHTYYMSLS